MEPLTIAAWALVLLLAPIALLLWLTESHQQKVVRYRRRGWSQQRIANHLRISRYQVRQALAGGAA